MGWRRRAGGGKRDAAEKGIVDALQAVGAQTWQLSGTGNPDVLVLFQGTYYVAEVKTGKGRMRPAQADIPWPIWRTSEEALAGIGIPRE